MEKLELLLAPICAKERIKKVFQFGSRVWGSTSAQSDWDFFVVIEGYSGVVHPELDLSLINQEVDVSAYSEERWKELLLAHDMLVLICEFFPPQFTWKNTYDGRAKVSLKTLVRGVSKEMSTCLSLSNIHFVKNGDKRTGIKNFVHATRYLAFGTQLATQGRLTDLGASNATLKEALQLLADNPTAEYDFFLQIYKPIITQRTKEFQLLVQGMLENEVASVGMDLANGVSPEKALLAFLAGKEPDLALADLYRVFSVTSALRPSASGRRLYQLQPTIDSPEGHPVTIVCGAALVEFTQNGTWHILARPFGYVASVSLNTTSFGQTLTLDSNNTYKALIWPTGSEQIVSWYDTTTNAWSCYCANPVPNSDVFEASFMASFALQGLVHPEDKAMVISWRFNPRPQDPLLDAICAVRPSVSGLVALESTTPPHTSTSDFAPVADLVAFQWPLAKFEHFGSQESLRIWISYLEANPFDFAGAYLPSFEGGTFIESRSHQARLILTLPEEQRRDTYQFNQNAKHIALATCLARNERREELLSGLNSFTVDAILSELDAYRVTMDGIKFFWDILRPHADDPAAFAKAISTLKIWRRVAAILHVIRQHPTRDPFKILLSAPATVFNLWKSVFAADDIGKLIRAVREAQLASLSTSS